MKPFKERLSDPRVIVLDGAIGTELESRGVKFIEPLWSASALLSKADRRILRTLHSDYIQAGAEIITANTFRTNYRTLEKAGLETRARELTQIAVDEACAAKDISRNSDIFIAGSVAPVEDCYRPDLVPSDDSLYDEHRRHIDHLYKARVDVLLIETMNTLREAVSVMGYAKQTGLPALVSFLPGKRNEILSGEPIKDMMAVAVQFKMDTVLVNCASPKILDTTLMELLKESGALPVGAYANCLPEKPGGKPINAVEYSMFVKSWIDRFHLKIVGGCCGTTPEHIRLIKELI